MWISLYRQLSALNLPELPKGAVAPEDILLLPDLLVLLELSYRRDSQEP